MQEPRSTRLLAYCRPGFEGECAQELLARDTQSGAGGGHARTERGSAHVEYVAVDANGADRLAAAVGEKPLIFARQTLRVVGHANALPTHDRLGVLLPIIDGAHIDGARIDGAAIDRASGESTPLRWCDAWVEAPDSDAARELAPLCRGLNAALIATLKRTQRIDRTSRWRLHVCMTATDIAFVAFADVARAAPWPGGIPRLAFPRAAPSRSTLKLEEAFLVLLSADERERWLRPGMRAVDLGAAPGGWTYQFVARGIRVAAIDNGPIDAGLLESGLVAHRRVDGFRYRPPQPVDWLVCDMVEQPRRVAALIGDWFAQGACRYAMFNLKLPMKKRYAEVTLCFDLLNEAAVPHRIELRARQLYHDREEITVFARRT